MENIIFTFFFENVKNATFWRKANKLFFQSAITKEHSKCVSWIGESAFQRAITSTHSICSPNWIHAHGRNHLLIKMEQITYGCFAKEHKMD